ncbi:MAG: arginine deiminase family protein [Candidatus Micrarchaeales archaeon]|jgi:arginine deiminase|uniref:Amidinotransferase n=1 Tax=Candidatus Micrarchaeum acidiphilum ARMAN-2 TaxID=425595 RepID=C7DHI7_MICA2|nr:MAG: amidinotransferase [Candidatus Micrarchaeum acidiphilum ARMAN-2]MCW6160658.1 arginine deiminase family protein [Candidatus Micrarchaeales archaeon]
MRKHTGENTRGRIRSEWGTLKEVAIHRPGFEMFLGLLNPEASLYERAFNRHSAIAEHRRFEEMLKDDFGIKVVKLRDAVLKAADRNAELRAMLIDNAMGALGYLGDPKKAKAARAELKKNVNVYDSDHFFDILVSRPTIDLHGTRKNEPAQLRITSTDPLTNLYFMRDQQLVTDKGVFISRMAKPQRRHETELTKLLWKALGIKIVHEAEENAIIEGGDFMPMKDFALLGEGDRTNAAGVSQMLKYGADFDEVAVVHQPSHPLMPGSEPDPMLDMHLDMYFNVAGSSTVVGSGLLMRHASVDVYQKEGRGRYSKARGRQSLYEYIKGKGFNIIELSTLEQLSYASNFLCVKDGVIIAISTELIAKSSLEYIALKARADPHRYGALHAEMSKEYNRFRSTGQIFPHSRELLENGIDFYAVNLQNLTGGYGGAHCMTAPIERS